MSLGSVSASNTDRRIQARMFTLGPFETNCYVLWVETTPTPDGSRPKTPCWIIDAGFEPAPLIEFVQENNLRPSMLILTHAHADHIAGVAAVLRAFRSGPDGYSIPVAIHGAERDWLGDPELNLSGLTGMMITAPEPDRVLKDEEHLELDGTSWRVLATPGHSPGGITLYCEPSQVAIVGDTLFAGSVGRTDFPGSDPEQLERSIREKLYVLPDNTSVLPGHGPPTTIGRERRSNPYVRG